VSSYRNIAKKYYINNKFKVEKGILLVLVLIAITLLSCHKEKLDRAIAGSGPCSGCASYDLVSYNVSIRKVNNYAAGSKIFVVSYFNPQIDTGKILIDSVFTKTLPTNDTTFFKLGFGKSVKQIQWKIVAGNNDSLSSGQTSQKTIINGLSVYEVAY
jgi:hypothetical protein